MALVDSYPTDPRLQPVTIGTAEIVFASDGPEWDEFTRKVRHLAGIKFDAAPKKDADEFLASLKNRIALLARQTLSQTKPQYRITDYDARRGSYIVTLDFSIIPADIVAILGVSATVLYKALKDYKTLRENAFLIYNDLAVGVNAIANQVAMMYKSSFRRMEFTRHVADLMRAIGMAAVYEEYREDPTLHDLVAFEKKMKAEQEALNERIQKAQAEGRLSGGEKIVVKRQIK